MSVLTNGISALNAFRSQLTTTSHNVANVNTEGYSRQVVDLSTRPETFTTAGYLGNGVQIAEISRQFDQFLMDRVRLYTSSTEDAEIFLQRAKRVDDLIADPDAGLSRALQNFFAAVQDVANDPTQTSTRDVMLSSANILADRFQSVHSFMEGLRTEVNQDVEVLVTEANTLAESVAQINREIIVAQGRGNGNPPNDLLDKRDLAITRLAELVNVTAVSQDDGSVNVFLGNGQALIVGTRAFELDTSINNSEPDRLDITLESGGGNTSVITNYLNGGKLGGYVRFRETILDPTQNALGRLALGLGTFFNEQHNRGMDLNGDLGVDMFRIPDPTDASDVFGQQMLLQVSGSASITNVDVSELSTSDYELSYDGVSWSLLDRQTNSSQTLVPNASNEVIFDGLTVDLGAPGTWSNGDLFIVRPTRLAARAFDVDITNSRLIAAASPIGIASGPRTAAPAGPNTGTAQVSDSGLSSRTGNTLLAAPVTLTFDAGANQFNLSNGDTVAYNPATDSGNTLNVVLAASGSPDLGTFSFTLTGTPDDGDVFVLSSNSNNAGGAIAVGDNRNMLKLADLQFDKTMRDNTAGEPTSSFVTLYSSLIGEVGSKTRQGLLNQETQTRLKEQAETAFDEVSGVNLDEEAANLVLFQQAYQAATQVIRVSNQLFDSLLNSVG